jgi:hypothetical protein
MHRLITIYRFNFTIHKDKKPRAHTMAQNLRAIKKSITTGIAQMVA